MVRVGVYVKLYWGHGEVDTYAAAQCANAYAAPLARRLGCARDRARRGVHCAGTAAALPWTVCIATNPRTFPLHPTRHATAVGRPLRGRGLR